ncbi:MAG: CBS domain-containing protein [Candidatus Dadabacteria bacterium]|nr:MAG: CBS domain-containing protein [Candidatus Dadabacteria bacterium]
MLVSELMTKNPVSLTKEDTVRDAVEKMYELDIRHLPVLDEEGAVLGIVTDKDISSCLALGDISDNNSEEVEERLSVSVLDIMHEGAITVTEESPISDVIEIMVENKFGAVPVVSSDDGKLIGIVSYIDLLKEAQEYFEEK